MSKKILLSKVGGNIMLMRVDTETKLIEYTTNGTDWFQPLLEEATTSSAGLMSAADKTILDGLSSSSVSWDTITDKPTLFSGAYSELTGKPIDLTSYDNSYDGHITKFSYQSGGIDAYTRHLFHFDDSIIDAIGNATVTLQNDTPSYVTGKFSNAVSATLDTCYLGWILNPSFDSFSFTTPMTWSFWIKPTSVSSLISDGFGPNVVSQFQDSYWSWLTFRYDSDYKFQVVYFYRNGVYSENTTAVQLTPTVWQHVSVVHEGSGVVKIFINGALKTSKTFTYFEMGNNGGTWGNGECFVLGGRRNGSGFGGVLDEYKIDYGIARYTADFTPPSAPYSTTETRALYVDSFPISVIRLSEQISSYTLILSDAGKLVTISDASANVLTIPLNSGVAYPVGTWIDISNIGAGTCTITAASGVTLNGADGGTKELVQWAGTRLYKIATDTWVTR